MASGSFSKRLSFGSQPLTIIFGNDFMQVDSTSQLFPPKYLTMDLPSKRSLSQMSDEHDIAGQTKRRKLSWTGNTAQRVKKLLLIKKNAKLAAKRIASATEYRNSRETFKQAVTLDYAMLEIPRELRPKAVVVNTAAPTAISLTPLIKPANTQVPNTPAKQATEASLIINTPIHEGSISTPPSLTHSVTTSSSGSASPITPVNQIYKSRGLTGGDSKFAIAGFQPAVPKSSWGLADYPREKQPEGAPLTVRINLSKPEQSTSTLEPATALKISSQTQILAETNIQSEAIPRSQGFVPSEHYDWRAAMRRREAERVAFNAEATERRERDIDGQYYARWCCAVINAGELVYDPMRVGEVAKSRWSGQHR